MTVTLTLSPETQNSPASDFVALAVATANAASPCGSCRQFLSEFGLETLVVLVDAEGTITKQTTLRDLLPDAFGPGQVKR